MMLMFWLIVGFMLLMAASIVAFPFLIYSRTHGIVEMGHRFNFLFIALIVIVLPLGAFTLYLDLGASHAMAERMMIEQRMYELRLKLGSLDDIILMLKQKLQQNPRSAEGWFLLGKFYLRGGYYHEAVEALAKANQLKPQQADIMSFYAKARDFATRKTRPVSPISSQLPDLSP